MKADEQTPLNPEKAEPSKQRRGPPSSIVAKGIATFLTIASVAAFVILIVIQVHENKNGPLPVKLVPCSFVVPFQNWVNYGDAIGKGCPVTGTSKSCESYRDCVVDAACTSGSQSLLQCVLSNFTGYKSVCGFLSRTLPSDRYDAGNCDTNSLFNMCSLCVTGVCQGVALCAKGTAYNASVTEPLGYDLLVYPDGHKHFVPPT